MDEEDSRYGRRKQRNPRKQNVDGDPNDKPQTEDNTTATTLATGETPIATGDSPIATIADHASPSDALHSESSPSSNSCQGSTENNMADDEFREKEAGEIIPEKCTEVTMATTEKLEELMQRGDTAVIFPEPVEHITAPVEHITANNNNNNDKGTESPCASPASAGSSAADLLRCPHCSVVCPSLPALRDHVHQLHSSSPHLHHPHPVVVAAAPSSPAGAVQVGDSPCPQCGALCQGKDELEKHLTLHCPVVQECKTCQKTFANVYRLQRHMLTHEDSTELRKFKCPECPKAFKFKHHLKEHIRIHSGEKPFECSNCGKRFSHSGSYSSHMTSKKCWVGNAASATTMKARSKMAPVEPPRPGDVLRPLVPKGDDNGDVTPLLYQNPMVDPALLQYTLAMRPFLSYTAGHVMNPYALNNFQQLLMNSSKGLASMVPPLVKTEPIVATAEESEDAEKTATSGDEKENKQEEKDSEKSEQETEQEERAQTEVKVEEEEEQKEETTIKKVLEIVEATAASQQQASDLSKLSALASAASQELQQFNSSGGRCRYCALMFGSAVDLHQHERYMCHHALQAASPPDLGDDKNSDDGHGCRVRSILSDEQKRHLEAQYANNPWPTKVDMERLAGDTGLARRVIQVWFQNCRARDRRKGKSIPERPVGLRTPETYGSNMSPTHRTPEPSRPYIPRVPQIPRPVQTAFFPVVTTPTSTNIQVEPLDLSNKPGQLGFDQALNLSTKVSNTPPPSLFPFSTPQQTEEEIINTTPAHSTPRTTPERHCAPLTPAPERHDTTPTEPPPQRPILALTPPPPAPRTSTPTTLLHRSSPAVFPTMVPSPLMTPTSVADVTSDMPSNELTPTSLESSFSSMGSNGEDRRERKRSWRQMESDGDADDEDLEAKRKRKSWKQHRVDTIDGMYTCDQCDKLFSKQSSLARHKYEHSGQRPFPCDTCGKAFKHKHHLTEHKRLHSGEKPFECTKCGKRFSHSGSYSQHMNHRYKYCKPEGGDNSGMINPEGGASSGEGGVNGGEGGANESDMENNSAMVSPASIQSLQQ